MRREGKGGIKHDRSIVSVGFCLAFCFPDSSFTLPIILLRPLIIRPITLRYETVTVRQSPHIMGYNDNLANKGNWWKILGLHASTGGSPFFSVTRRTRAGMTRHLSEFGQSNNRLTIAIRTTLSYPNVRCARVY